MCQDAKPVQLRHEPEMISKTYNIESKNWQERAIISLTRDLPHQRTLLDSELGSVAFNVPYNLMYHKQYLTDWEAESGKNLKDSEESGSEQEGASV